MYNRMIKQGAPVRSTLLASSRGGRFVDFTDDQWYNAVKNDVKMDSYCISERHKWKIIIQKRKKEIRLPCC